MLHPKHQLLKRGALLDQAPRMDRKVCAAIGFPDFASGISVVFSGFCPATVSDSETVFLCPEGSAVAALQPVASFWIAADTTSFVRFSYTKLPQLRYGT
ncbi:hypothetical protein [Hymenobacter latericus]|uniref:hypothetical protein n=1 Tax=Hymenobacter sp. YIM 151858-1 TaxID=2987688 RepID=UPI002226BD91|nr:hypothetical protein [Hymenobacter sp. YIM 151858-1]UYZ59871.1 hypothetical protein OIS50_03525 [Hymenobacter sp. YIM 151858-1]